MNSKSQADTTSSTRSEYSDWTRNLEQGVETDRLEVGVDSGEDADIGVSSGARSQSRRPGGSSSCSIVRAAVVVV